jgi:pimeloyl-ACP methyl ester carboxylesterase
LIDNLSPLSAAAVTLRGRGKSSRPDSGYSLCDHCSDIAAFVNYLPVDSVVLVAFSRSVSYALEYAIGRPSKLSGLVLLDYPPRHGALRAGWAEAFAQSSWRGRRVDEVVNLAMLHAMEAEAVAKDFTAHLPSIRIPALVVRGCRPGAALSVADAETYQTGLSNCALVEFEDSAHALWEPEPKQLCTVIAQFARNVRR